MITIIAVMTFLCGTLSVAGVCWLWMRRMNSAKRLQTAGGATTTVTLPDDDALAALAEKFARPLNRLVPPSLAEANKLQKQLMQAGYLSKRAPIIYRGLQVAALVVLPFLSLVTAILTGQEKSNVLLSVLMSFISGFFLPRRILAYLIKRRQQRILWGLADALDLMVVSMEAGLGINAARAKVSDELIAAHPEISEEFDMVNREIRFGRERPEALRNLADRTGVEDLRSFVQMLIQADRFGTSIGRAVRAYSEALRIKRRQRAEQTAQKAAVKLLFPLTCFLFPTLFIIILGPAVIRMIDAFAGNLK